MLTEPRKQEVISLCQEMIRGKSLSGEEWEMAKVLKAYCLSHGYDDTSIDRYGSCVARIKGSRPGPRVLFDGHMDTVPVPDPSLWTHDPFGGEISDGKIYGRGASDMKGAIAAMAVAGSYLKEITGGDFAGEIYVAGVVHEECFEGVAAREISAYVKPDYVIIGEASRLNIKIAQRGRAEIVAETFGRPAHSANPEKGINAVYKMCSVIQAIMRLKPAFHQELGEGIMALTDIRSSPYPGASVIPDYCRATFDRRLLVGETKESVLRPLKELIAQMTQADPELKARVDYAQGSQPCYTGDTISGERFFPGWLYEKEEPFVEAVLKELVQCGFSPEITHYNFCTNGSHYAGEAGIKTLGLGPSREDLAHTIDEYIEIGQLLGASEAYTGVMRALLRPEFGTADSV